MPKLPAFLQPLERAYVKWKMRNSRFAGSRTYWEERYAKGGNSGPGSYDRYAEFKARVMNDLIERHGVRSAIEFGCGDGNQLSMIRYPRYLGLDVSPTAVEGCRRKFANDPTRSFRLYEAGSYDPSDAGSRADLTVSLDVLFHLVEDEVYTTYMEHLFASADRLVVIYARDVDGPQTYHERNRSFTRFVRERLPAWAQLEKIGSPFLAEARNEQDAANVAEFFVFAKEQGS